MLAYCTILPYAVMAAIAFANSANAFAPATTDKTIIVAVNTRTALQMGLFDAFSKAFENNDYGPPAESIKASARHILVQSEPEAKVIMKMITSGESTFEDCARDYSTCPSASKGGSLGSFGPGTMVPEFDKVIFDPETQVGELMGPILTDFGFHIIILDKRSGGGDWY